MKTNLTNKKLGNDFESEFCQLLFDQGWWVHTMTQNAAGQPADVIAVKDHKALLIDCKVCTRKGFALSRVEENQHFAMNLWRDRGNGEAWFAIKTVEGEIIMIPHLTIKAVSHEKSVMNLEDLREYGTKFERWVKKICK